MVGFFWIFHINSLKAGTNKRQMKVHSSISKALLKSWPFGQDISKHDYSTEKQEGTGKTCKTPRENNVIKLEGT